MLSIIIPAYNEESTIIEVLNRLLDLDIDKEIIVIDDGSTDNTREKISQLTQNLDIRVISLKKIETRAMP